MFDILRKRYDIETLSIDSVLNKKVFMEKSFRKYVPKACQRPLFYVSKQSETAITCMKFFYKKSFSKRLSKDYWKPLKKLTLFFLLNPVSFNEQSYQKQKGPVTSGYSLFGLRNKFTKISLLYYILSDQVSCNIKRFLSYSKHYICKFIQANL